MKILNHLVLLLVALPFVTCASGYKYVGSMGINFISKNSSDNISQECKYDVLENEYYKKKQKKGLKLMAIKIANNCGRDLKLGTGLLFKYGNGTEIQLLEKERVYKELKQSLASHLFYLLLTPLNLYNTSANSVWDSEVTNTIPIGLLLGPGLAGGNLIAARSAKENFKNELSQYEIYGTTIKKGTTEYGIIGIKSDTFETI